jgi:hypothetical protein
MYRDVHNAFGSWNDLLLARQPFWNKHTTMLLTHNVRIGRNQFPVEFAVFVQNATFQWLRSHNQIVLGTVYERSAIGWTQHGIWVCWAWAAVSLSCKTKVCNYDKCFWFNLNHHSRNYNHSYMHVWQLTHVLACFASEMNYIWTQCRLHMPLNL